MAVGEIAHWRNLLAAVPDTVVVSDAGGVIVYVNPAIERFFGHRPEALIGKSVEVLVPEHFRDRHKTHRGGYHAEPRRRSMGYGADLRAVRADGSEIPVSISLGFTPTERGNLVVAIIQDLSELRRRDRSIQELNERAAKEAELRELNNELEAFSYSVSHDLRAPLRAIDGFSQVLQEEYADKIDKPGREFINRIRNAAQRMGVLIDDMLKLSRISRADLVPKPVDLTAMVQQIVDNISAAERGRTVEVTIAPGMTAQGDDALLRIAMTNLIGNAWKFSAGRDPARIEIGQQEIDGVQTTFVKDNGAGFDMEYAGKLFGAFQRMANAQSFPGNGIGLATVQRVINRHGGRIWAESRVDEGATFFFTLFQGNGNGSTTLHSARRG